MSVLDTRGALLALALLGGTAQAADTDPAATLEAAYQKEFVFLAAEKAALEARVDEVRADRTQRVGGAEAELARLQARLLALQADADAAQDVLDGAERETTAVVEDAELVGTTLFQAAETLQREGFALPQTTETPEEQAAALELAFDEVRRRQASGAAVRSETGSYFLRDGEKVEGTLVRVGNIAAYGLSERGTGALAPAGAGRLQLRSEDAEVSARVLGGTGASDHVGVFLFESLDKRVEEKSVKTLATLMEGGGLVGWVIVLLGLAGLMMAALRAVVLAGVKSRGDAVVERVAPFLAAGDVHAAGRAVKAGDGAAGRVIGAVLGQAARGGSREGLEDAAGEAVLRELPKIDRFGAAILVIAAVAPLLGLLGTVTGMIRTFEIITEFGTGDPKMLSGGISEALITTQLGLVVAIPMLLLGNLLSGRANTVAANLERSALALLTRLDQPASETVLSVQPEPREDAVA